MNTKYKIGQSVFFLGDRDKEKGWFVVGEVDQILISHEPVKYSVCYFGDTSFEHKWFEESELFPDLPSIILDQQDYLRNQLSKIEKHLLSISNPSVVFHRFGKGNNER